MLSWSSVAVELLAASLLKQAHGSTTANQAPRMLITLSASLTYRQSRGSHPSYRLLQYTVRARELKHDAASHERSGVVLAVLAQWRPPRGLPQV